MEGKEITNKSSINVPVCARKYCLRFAEHPILQSQQFMHIQRDRRKQKLIGVKELPSGKSLSKKWALVLLKRSVSNFLQGNIMNRFKYAIRSLRNAK